MSTESSREDRIRYLLRVSRALLTRADDLVQGDTEYLRDEIEQLMTRTDELLEKMNFEQTLLILRNELHGVADETHETDGAHETDVPNGRGG